MPSLYFEDFVPGSVAPYAGVTVEREAMVAFARLYDAQPMHVDEAAAKHTMMGELIASGWYTAALNNGMIVRSFLLDASSMGSPGVSELKWLKPVRAGDRLSGIRHVLDRRPSLSKPDRGFVNFRFDVLNQNGETVMEQTNLIMLGRRGSDPVADSAAKPFAETQPELPAFRDVTLDTLPFYEDLAVGDRMVLGSVAFTADDIIRFAEAFDPQAFHLDERAAKASHFGALAASGWHTGAHWMGQMVKNRTAASIAAVKRGERPARLGASPGFQHLRWRKPVLAGDVIRYTSAIYEKRASASRPEWGIVRHYNTGVNQKGEAVFSFIGSVFWERRPAA
jgi:acyl dehydratase